jgi:ferritin-like metal-binding protein YciE
MKTDNSKERQQSSNQAMNPANPKWNAAAQLRELFLGELKDIYWAEKELVDSIPKLIENASSQELVNALQDHLDVTKTHVSRCEQVFNLLGMEAEAVKCPAMAGLTKEANEIIKETQTGAVRDAGIISAAQKVEHYEIASYGTLRTFAMTLGLNEAADLLSQTLNEEKEADEKLTQIAESSINIEAAGEEGRSTSRGL